MPPQEDHCGSCRACLDICPTKAFPAPYQLDARRCISYLTIEHKGHIAREFRKAMGNRIYGCDDCLAVCPWNKFAVIAARSEAQGPRGSRPAGARRAGGLDDAGFRKLFAGSPVKRTGRDRFVRNVLIAIGNSGEPRLADTRRAACSATARRWSARWRSGRCRSCARASRFQELARDMHWPAKTMRRCAPNGGAAVEALSASGLAISATALARACWRRAASPFRHAPQRRAKAAPDHAGDFAALPL